jgi:hypothetical protein
MYHIIQFDKIQPILEAAGGTSEQLYPHSQHTTENNKPPLETEISLEFLLKHQYSCFVDPSEYYNTLCIVFLFFYSSIKTVNNNNNERTAV